MYVPEAIRRPSLFAAEKPRFLPSSITLAPSSLAACTLSSLEPLSTTIHSTVSGLGCDQKRRSVVALLKVTVISDQQMPDMRLE